MNQEESMKKWQQIIAKAWMDEKFKQKLLSDSAAVLKEEGVEMPEGFEVRVVENTGNVFHLVLPERPSGDEMSEETLEEVAAGIPSTTCLRTSGFSNGTCKPQPIPPALCTCDPTPRPRPCVT